MRDDVLVEFAGADDGADAAPGNRRLRALDRRLDDGDPLGRDAAGEPAPEQRAAHLAAADEHDRPGDSTHASPTVSNSAAAIASEAVVPPQMTNWNAG